MTRFQGKSVIVTGAGSGVGAAAARRFAQEGALVCAADIDAAKAEGTASAIGAAGGTAFALRTDISARADNEAMIEAACARFGRLDVAFLNAGVLGALGGFEAEDDAAFDHILSVNLRGCFLGLRAVHSRIERGGAVVVTASSAGLVGFAESPAYAASKHGVLGLVKSCAPAFANRGARINAICPGRVNTPMIGFTEAGDLKPSGELERPRLRGGMSAQHVAEFALYLASDQAAAITGGAHVIDAGLLSTFVPAPEGD